ncbi:C2 domain-containing protein [Lactarius vividus]|nr:C2 domain-containing protein [Lactarius vividus]
MLRLPFGRGSNKYSSPPNPREVPVVFLRVQVISCRGLEAKDGGGRSSDPFVTVSLWGKKFQTPVSKQNLNPNSTMLEFVVWDKDKIGKDYLGEYSLPVNKWFKGSAFRFDGPDNKHFSVPLYSSRPTETVSGSIDFKVGFVYPPGSTGQLDFGKIYDTLRKVGTVMVEICGIKDLPKWPNMSRTGFDMDPFVEVSIGEDVQRTSVIEHQLNPTWNKRLFFHVREDDLSRVIRLVVFDKDKTTANDYVGEAEITIPKKDTPTCDFERPLKPATDKKPKHPYGNCTPTITFRANYQSMTLTYTRTISRGVLTPLPWFLDSTPPTDSGSRMIDLIFIDAIQLIGRWAHSLERAAYTYWTGVACRVISDIFFTGEA